MSDSASILRLPMSRRRLTTASAILAGLLLVGTAAAAVAHWLFSADVLKSDIALEIRRTTGFSTSVEGPAQLRLFPRPHLEFRNIEFSDPSSTIYIEAKALTGYLRLLPLLVGRIEVGHAVLYQPAITVAAGHISMPDNVIGQNADNQPANPANGTLLGRIDIVDGHANFETRRGPARSINDITLSFDWPRLDASADVSGRMTWGGAPLHFQAWLSQPREVLRGGQSATVLRLKSDLLNLATSGRVSMQPRLQYSGHLLASAASVQKIVALLGYPATWHAGADLNLSCDVDFKAGNAGLTNLRLRLDGNDYEGDLAIQDDAGAPRFSGTLASDLLDVTPYLANFKTSTTVGDMRSYKAGDFAKLAFPELDLRVSASRLRLHEMEIDDAALSLVTKPSLVDLALAQASANKGTIKGRILLESKGQNAHLRISGSGSNIDIRPMVLGFEGKRPLSGSLNALVTVESTGPDVDRLIQGLAGQIQLAVSGGGFKGVDLAATLQGAKTKSPGERIDRIGGTTNFDTLQFGLNMANGRAEITQGKFVAPGMQTDFAGNADLRADTLDVAAIGEMHPLTSRGLTASQQLSFNLKGALGDLHIFQGQPGLRLPAPPRRIDALPDGTMSYAPTSE